MSTAYGIGDTRRKHFVERTRSGGSLAVTSSSSRLLPMPGSPSTTLNRTPIGCAGETCELGAASEERHELVIRPRAARSAAGGRPARIRSYTAAVSGAGSTPSCSRSTRRHCSYARNASAVRPSRARVAIPRGGRLRAADRPVPPRESIERDRVVAAAGRDPRRLNGHFDPTLVEIAALLARPTPTPARPRGARRRAAPTHPATGRRGSGRRARPRSVEHTRRYPGRWVSTISAAEPSARRRRLIGRVHGRRRVPWRAVPQPLDDRVLRHHVVPADGEDGEQPSFARPAQHGADQIAISPLHREWSDEPNPC